MILRRIARPLLGTAFIASGIDAVTAPAGPARTAEPLLENVPADTETVIRVAGAVQVGAGLALAFGKAPRIASTVLAGTLVPTTVFASDFWNENDPAVRSAKQSAFVKNLGLLGGVLIASADTEGRPSLGWRGRRRLVDARESIVEALPGESGQDTLTASVNKAEQWAHQAADRVPTDRIAANASTLAASARSRAEDLAHTVADRAPDVIDATRQRAEQWADEVAHRAPEAADTVADTTRRWRRALAR
ncbi:DoxX family protein [Gordonia sp. PDNC005]|uniref:DoxX family protein n=1 Tax=unclassified Gordonia (in: high G+C Gram-positive bacteria) TaxID=2657482 RepID=UPI00196289E0|nr:DoxX family protein [Gordonia sp. PDNC005]QRY64405.1 DoxX family protein [Gordonia sp. PDNC005]